MSRRDPDRKRPTADRSPVDRAPAPPPPPDALEARLRELARETAAELLASYPDALQAAAEAYLAGIGRDEAVARHLGAHVLLPYASVLRANGLSDEHGLKLRKQGRLKVLDVEGKLMVRAGEWERFVRSLPLKD